MEIRNTTINDIPRLHQIFAYARLFMKSTGNPNQWADDYPSDEQLLNDINSGVSYVIEVDGRIVATFVLVVGEDPTYSVIYDGAWKNNRPYATIHRIANGGEVKGVFEMVVKFALSKCSTLRIDTHRDNSVMQHCILKQGFEYCGIIHCWNGDERMAYQFN